MRLRWFSRDDTGSVTVLDIVTVVAIVAIVA